MNRNDLKEAIIQELRALSGESFVSVILQYCSLLTISARMSFVDKEYQAAQDCNEVLHRILGFLRTELIDARPGQKDSMIATIVESAEQKHRLGMLRTALTSIK